MFLQSTLGKLNTKGKLLKFKLLLLLMVCCFFANAQVNFYQPFSIGAGYGVTIAVAGEETFTSSNAASVNLNYHFSPFVSATLEAQFGLLTGGDYSKDTYGKQFENNYKAFTLHADAQLGEFIDYEHNPFLNGLKNLHAGIGVGILTNDISNIALLNPVDNSTHTYLKTSTNVVVPVRLGYEFKIFSQYNEPQVRLDLNYEFNTAFGAGLDGYTSVYTKSYINFYNYFSVSLKYSFGRARSYRKQIYYSNF